MAKPSNEETIVNQGSVRLILEYLDVFLGGHISLEVNPFPVYSSHIYNHHCMAG
jgi:hypothetical protein